VHSEEFGDEEHSLLMLDMERFPLNVPDFHARKFPIMRQASEVLRLDVELRVLPIK